MLQFLIACVSFLQNQQACDIRGTKIKFVLMYRCAVVTLRVCMWEMVCCVCVLVRLLGGQPRGCEATCLKSIKNALTRATLSTSP